MQDVDPDQKQHSAASDLGLHCLPMSHLWDTWPKWVNLFLFAQKRLCTFRLDWQTTCMLKHFRQSSCLVKLCFAVYGINLSLFSSNHLESVYICLIGQVYLAMCLVKLGTQNMMMFFLFCFDMFIVKVSS